MQPRTWCYPNESFGKITENRKDPRTGTRLLIQTRQWRAPSRPESDPGALNDWADFRAAIIQNACAVHLRAFKNAQIPQITRHLLADADGRPDSFSKWTARLNGTRRWNLDDTAVVLRHFPGALPDWPDVQIFLDVATGVRGRPLDWVWPDTAGSPRRNLGHSVSEQ